MKMMQRLGPGLLYAGAAVGVSHIYQSTSAGASFGWIMIVAVLLANILKYPFFEFGPRYAAATGKSLLHGYKNLGNWALWLFLLLTIFTMFIIQAAVTIVTSGLAIRFFGIACEPQHLWIVSAAILIICILILYYGRYAVLTKLMRIIMVILAVTTLVAFIISFGADIDRSSKPAFILNDATMLFLISFIGWMPAPLDISVWHSVWSVSEMDAGTKQSMRRSLFDFRVGFWGTVVLAILFVGLGTLMIFGTGKTMPQQAGAFASELIDIYASALGNWSKPFIGLAAFTTMFSTTITCLDAFPRVIIPTIKLIGNKKDSSDRPQSLMWLIITSIGAIVILRFFTKSMADLILFITILSFLAAPVIGSLNYLSVKQLPNDSQPSTFLKVLSLLGMIVMVILSLYYLLMLT